eukprot:m.248406 g.248406  ORF g.248406 m.248406 type:complete len:259 (+) comp40289_c0_seq2:1126-1902(+)
MHSGLVPVGQKSLQRMNASIDESNLFSRSYRKKLKTVFKTCCAELLRSRHFSKPLHGQLFTNMQSAQEVDKRLSFRWLSSPALKSETEGFVVAIQDQVIATNYYKHKIMKIAGTDGRCRMCKSAQESIHHLLSSCQALAGSLYVDRHNNVGKYVHWCICKDSGIDVPSQWYVHMPTPVRENSQFKILWDLAIQTDKTIPANRPDIVVLNKSRQTVQIIDVSIPHDNNITKNIKRKFRNIEISDLKLNVCGMSRPWSYL